MMKILFVAPYVPSVRNAINVAALYFDEIVLHERTLLDIEPLQSSPDGKGVWKGRIRSFVSAIDDNLRREIRPLLDEKVVRIEEAPPRHLLPAKQRERMRAAFSEAEELIFVPREVHDREVDVDVNVGSSGIAEVHQRLVGPVQVGGLFHIQAISTYYEGLFTEVIEGTLRGEPVLSSSSLLYSMLERAAHGSALKPTRIAEAFPNLMQPRLAMDVLDATLLDSSGLECEDVLEARHALRNELAAFRTELQRIQFDFTQEFGIEKVFREGRDIASARLAPRVKDIEGKVRAARVGVLKRLLEALEKPGAYVPLVGSVFAGVPLEIALAISLGLISTRVAVETWEEHKQVANDGLFYLVKMRDVLRGKTLASNPNAAADRITSDRDASRRVFKWPEDVLRIDDPEKDSMPQ